MRHAPFLLQAFAARVLATKQSETVLREDLEKQGYDVVTLVEMIEAYATLPEPERGFIVHATPTEIHIRRKGNAVVQAASPPVAVPKPVAVPAAVATQKEPIPSPGLAALVRFADQVAANSRKTRESGKGGAPGQPPNSLAM